MRDFNNRYNNRSEKNTQSLQVKIVIVMVMILVTLGVFMCIKWAKNANTNEIMGLVDTEISTSSIQPIDNSDVITASSDNQNVEQIIDSGNTDEITNGEDQTTSSDVDEEQNKTIHISETINGSVISLAIDLDVTTYEDMTFGIYDASPIDLDIDECLEYVFTEYSRDELYYVYGEEYYKNKFGSTDTVLYFLHKETEKQLMYDPNNEAVQFCYIIDGEQVQSDRLGHLMRREQDYILPDEDLLNEAVNMSDKFLTTIFKEEFTDNFVQIYSGKRKTETDMYHSNAATEVYLTVYQREIEGLQLLFDKRSVKMGYYSDPLIDEVEVWVNDGKILLAYGAIRHLELREKVDIISAEEALSILKTYFETVEAKGNYDISRYELMYYATFADDADTTDIYGKQVGAGYVKYIPVWVIASGERINTDECDEYVMIIDATTGEVVERRQ